MGHMALLTTILALSEKSNVIQIAFADDLTGIGRVYQLKSWWDLVLEYGPYIGYFVNESKSCKIAKENHLKEAQKVFKDSSIVITIKGH